MLELENLLFLYPNPIDLWFGEWTVGGLLAGSGTCLLSAEVLGFDVSLSASKDLED